MVRMGDTRFRIIGFLAAILSIPTVAESENLDSLVGRLDSVAYTNETRHLVSGEGRVTATILGGRTVTLTGAYSGLASPATSIRVLKGPRTGVPGREELALFTVAKPSTSGEFSQTLRLSKMNMSALAAGQIYLQIATESAPDGAIWGWIIRKRDTYGEQLPNEP